MQDNTHPVTPAQVRDAIRGAAGMAKHIGTRDVMAGMIRSVADMATDAGLDAYTDWLANTATEVEDSRFTLTPGMVMTLSSTLTRIADDLADSLDPSLAGLVFDQDGEPIVVGDIVVSTAEDTSGKVVALTMTTLDGPGAPLTLEGEEPEETRWPAVVIRTQEGALLTLAAEETKIVWSEASGSGIPQD